MTKNIIFKNYKKLINKSYTLEDKYLWLVTGDNETGKSTMINGLLSLLMAKDDTDVPVTHGKKEGLIEGSIALADGKEYRIKHEFTNDKHKFYLSDGIKNITKVTDIRKL